MKCVFRARNKSLSTSKFDTEKEYDKVEFFDAAGKKVGVLSGRNDDSFTVPFDGEYVKLVFTSDDSVQRYGFDITKAAWR